VVTCPQARVQECYDSFRVRLPGPFEKGPGVSGLAQSRSVGCFPEEGFDKSLVYPCKCAGCV
jgi:hypothetical protein